MGGNRIDLSSTPALVTGLFYWYTEIGITVLFSKERHMFRRTFMALAVGLLLPATIQAEVIEVKKVSINNGTTYQAISDLPSDVQAVAKHLVPHFKGLKPTFAFKEETLLVGLRKIPGLPEALGNIGVVSDCPDNSIFSIDRPQELASSAVDAKLKKALETWTRYRHKGGFSKGVTLRTINVTKFGDHERFDVQLNLDTVALK